MACIREACASNRSRVAAYHDVFHAFSQSLPENSWIVLQIRPRLLPSTFPFNLQMILPVDNIPGVTGQTNLGRRALGGTLDKSRVFLYKFQCSVATLLTLRRLMSYIYGAPILDVSRSHTTTQHSR